jgi:hypothetical protein
MIEYKLEQPDFSKILTERKEFLKENMHKIYYRNNL